MTPRESKAATPANRALVALVKKAYKDSGMSRAELVERSGVPAGTLTNILSGIRPVAAEQLLGFVDALGLDLDECLDVMRAARGEHE